MKSLDLKMMFPMRSEWSQGRIEKWFSSSNVVIYRYCEVHREYVRHDEKGKQDNAQAAELFLSASPKR